MDTPVPNFFEGVKQFQTACGRVEQDYNLQLFDPVSVGFYTGMQCEELAEKLTVIFSADKKQFESLWCLVDALEQLGHEFKKDGFHQAVASADRVQLLDADVDLLVVSEAAILTSGADGDGARTETNRSNLAKIVDGKLLKDETTGKVLKPEGWTPPNLAPYVCLHTKE